ncbi:kielin/chordin-like protein [Mercenaria mercenaria]|uniref:kielin/chordin-like protein n=1 Tax=Mercenaria mercenaria TaxID=6596 RepID=UPI00234EF095|nr:kielin/chordin-like protein [Mercenaria mercenaria]
MVSLAHILLLSGCTIVINGQYEGRPRLPNKCAAVFCGATDCLNPTTPPGECFAVCPPTLPPHCAAVFCLRPDCLNPTTPPGGCCPVCPGKTCFYKGVRREDGETFKDDCNTCTCNNGNVRCTKRGCRK